MIVIYNHIHMYVYRGLLQADHRERTVRNSLTWRKNKPKWSVFLRILAILSSHIARRESQPNEIRSFGPCLKPHDGTVNKEFIRLSIRFQRKAKLSGIAPSRGCWLYRHINGFLGWTQPTKPDTVSNLRKCQQYSLYSLCIHIDIEI